MKKTIYITMPFLIAYLIFLSLKLLTPKIVLENGTNIEIPVWITHYKNDQIEPSLAELDRSYRIVLKPKEKITVPFFTFRTLFASKGMRLVFGWGWDGGSEEKEIIPDGYQNFLAGKLGASCALTLKINEKDHHIQLYDKRFCFKSIMPI